MMESVPLMLLTCGMTRVCLPIQSRGQATLSHVQEMFAAFQLHQCVASVAESNFVIYLTTLIEP